MPFANGKTLDILGGFNRSKPLDVNAEDLINGYIGIDAEHKTLYKTPGLELERDFGVDGGGRRLYVSQRTKNIMHSVIGNIIFQIDKSLNISRGIEINTDSGFVGVTDNNYQSLFTDGVDGILFNSDTNQYNIITTPGFPHSPVSPSTLADRAIVGQKDTAYWYYSEINDLGDIKANNRYQVGGGTYPDIFVASATLGGKLFIFGKRLVELWYPQANPDDPFALDSNFVVDVGCAARGSVVQHKTEMIIWLASDDEGVMSVMYMTGGRPQKISNAAIDRLLQTFTDPEDATAFVYRMNGRLFYQLNFTVDNESLLYCFETKTWSRLRYHHDMRHRAQALTYFLGKHYCLDYQQAYLYNFSEDNFDDHGESIITKRITKRFYFGRNGKIIGAIRFEMRKGTGTYNGSDLRPQLNLRLSRDGGRTWGNKMSAKIGKSGQNKNEVIFESLGWSRSVVMEISHSYKVDFAIAGAEIFLVG